MKEEKGKEKSKRKPQAYLVDRSTEGLNDLPGPESEGPVAHAKYLEIGNTIVLEVTQRPQQVPVPKMEVFGRYGSSQDRPELVDELNGHSKSAA